MYLADKLVFEENSAVDQTDEWQNVAAAIFVNEDMRERILRQNDVTHHIRPIKRQRYEQVELLRNRGERCPEFRPQRRKKQMQYDGDPAPWRDLAQEHRVRKSRCAANAGSAPCPRYFDVRTRRPRFGIGSGSSWTKVSDEFRLRSARLTGVRRRDRKSVV